MRNTGTEYGSDERQPVILPELAELLPPLSRDQLTALKEDLRKNSCYSPIVVNEDLAIVDGHNRQRLCEELGIPYRMVVFSFEDMLEAKKWALDTQKGRRNLDKWELGKIALKLKPELEAKAKANQAAAGGDKYGAKPLLAKLPKAVLPDESSLSATSQKDTDDLENGIPLSDAAETTSVSDAEITPNINTRKELAQSVGIGERTMGKVMQIEEHAPPVVKEALDKKELSIDQGYNITRQVQDLPEEEREQAAAEAIESIEREKAEKDLEKRNTELYRQKKIADQFSKTFSKVLQLEPTEDNVRIWTECCRMTLDEMGDMAKEAREFADVFTSIADIMDQFIQERAA